MSWIDPDSLLTICLALAQGQVYLWMVWRIGLGRPPAAEEHWSVRARRIYPVRRAMLWASLLLPLLNFMVVKTVVLRSSAPATFPAGLAGLLSLALVAASKLRLNRRLGLRPTQLGQWLRDGLAVLLLLWPHLVLAAALWLSTPARLGLEFCAGLLAAALLALLVLFGLPLRIALFLRIALPASERLKRLARVAQQATGISAQRIIEVRWSRANAFALPWTGSVAITQGTMQRLTDEALVAIIAHELGHLAEGVFAKLARGAMVVLFLCCASSLNLVQAQWGLLGICVVVWTFFVATLLFRCFARRLERHADATADSSQTDPSTYACALEQLYRDALIPAVLPGRSQSHPHLYDRLRAVGVEPDYPRPCPPSGLRTTAAVFLPPLIVLLVDLALLAAFSAKGIAQVLLSWTIVGPSGPPLKADEQSRTVR